MEQKFSSTLQAGSWAMNAPVDLSNESSGSSNRPSSQAGSTKRMKSANHSNRNVNNDPGLLVRENSGNKNPMVPLLTLPGSLISASSLMSSNPSLPFVSNNGFSSERGRIIGSGRIEGEFYPNNGNYNYLSTAAPVSSNVVSLPGIGYNDTNSNNNSGDEKTKKTSKSKNKLPKTVNSNSKLDEGNSNNRMPNINGNIGGNNTYQQPSTNYNSNTNNNSYENYTEDADEIGTGENAGPLQDWGFAGEQPSSARGNKKKNKKNNTGNEGAGGVGHYQDISPEDQYDNYSGGGSHVGSEIYEDSIYSNENYPQINSKQGKKKKNGNSGSISNNSNGGMFPSIDNKHSTPRAGGGSGFSLPPI
jgi:hypothetical protein